MQVLSSSHRSEWHSSEETVLIPGSLCSSHTRLLMMTPSPSGAKRMRFSVRSLSETREERKSSFGGKDAAEECVWNHQPPHESLVTREPKTTQRTTIDSSNLSTRLQKFYRPKRRCNRSKNPLLSMFDRLQRRKPAGIRSWK